MSAALAPSPWPAPEPLHGAWRFGREVDLGGAQRAMQWVLRRNCSLTPRQALVAYALLSAVSLLIGLGFWFGGAPVVLVFTALELLALAVAMLVYARHATDRETILLDGQQLAVEHHHGPALVRTTFRCAWVRVEPLAGQGSLVELSGDGASACVGRYLPAGLRAELAQELRRAIRTAPLR